MTNGLFQAVHDCRYLQAKFLLESGININCRNGSGENLLIAAILRIGDPLKKQKMMKWLMTIGVDVSERDSKYGRDAVTWAAYLNRTEDVKVILRSKEEDVRLSNVDIFGRAALHYATLHNNIEVVGMLCKKFQRYHVSVDIKDLNQITPYIIAVKLRFVDCARLLLEVGGASSSQVTEGFFKSSNIWNGLEEFQNKGHGHHHQGHSKALPSVANSSDVKQNALPVVQSLVFSEKAGISSSASKIHHKRQKTAKTSKSKNSRFSFKSMEDFSTEEDYHSRHEKVRKKRDHGRLPGIHQSTQNLIYPDFLVKPASKRSYQKTVMPAVFNMLSQQVSESYVPPAIIPVTKPETPPPPVVTSARSGKGMSFGVLGNVSKFATMLKKKAQKKLQIE